MCRKGADELHPGKDAPAAVAFRTTERVVMAGRVLR